MMSRVREISHSKKCNPRSTERAPGWNVYHRLSMDALYPETAAPLHQDKEPVQSQRRLEELEHFVANAGIGLQWIGADGIIQWANEAQLQMLGYAREEFVGHHASEFKAEPELPAQILADLHRGKVVRDREAKMKCADGSVKTVVISATVFREAGKFVRAHFITRDITEQKRAETALRESERRFRALANAVPSMSWSAAADGTITWASEQWYEYTGLPAEQNSIDWPRLVLHPEDYERCTNQWESALEHGTNYSVEARNRRHDGQYRWFLTRAVPVRDEEGHVQAWFGTHTDIDSRKRAEERFVRLNETLIYILEAIPDVVFVVAPDGEIEFRNPAASRFMGAAGLNSLPPAIRAELDRVLTTGEHHLPTDFKTVHRFVIDHQERFFLNRIVCMMTPEQRVFGAVAMLQDITEFRLLDEVKTNLLATVSHELKTPLTGVLTALMVLLEQAWGPLNPKQTELLSIARNDSERLLRTLLTLLDLTRFESSALGLRFETATAEELVRAAVEEVGATASNAGVIITTEVDSGLPPVVVDRERIRHVLTNFLTNAVKFSPRGEKISVRVRRENGEIYFSVSDRGPGVAAEYQSRIFEKFFRIPDAPHAGAGLGLSIAREFVRAHGGRIGVRSEPGNGSEFYFGLPTPAQME
jgi:PAS domain S-box-containing protein